MTSKNGPAIGPLMNDARRCGERDRVVAPTTVTNEAGALPHCREIARTGVARPSPGNASVREGPSSPIAGPGGALLAHQDGLALIELGEGILVGSIVPGIRCIRERHCSDPPIHRTRGTDRGHLVHRQVGPDTRGPYFPSTIFRPSMSETASDGRFPDPFTSPARR